MAVSETRPDSYGQACAEHEWRVPERYNIAADVCDKHPRDKLAMIWERFDGADRELAWGELQDLANQAAHLLALARGRKRRPGRGRPPADPRDRRDLLRHLEARSDPALDVGPLRRRRDPPPPVDSTPKVLVTDAANAARFDASLVERDARPRRGRGPARRPPTENDLRGHLGRRPGPALLHLRDHRAWRRASSTPTATSSPTRSSPTATTSATPSASTAWASGPGRPGSRRFSARGASARSQCVYQREGGFDPARPARLPLAPRGHERLHHPDRDAGDDGDRRRRRALSAALPDRLLGGRAPQPGGDPLVSRAVRDHRPRLLRPHRVLPALRELPVHGGP